MSGQGAYILGCEGLRLTPRERAFFAEAQPWGFILFARNIEAPDQLRALCAELREAVGRDAPILIDQEGGRVQRLTPPHWRQWLPPLDQVARAGAGAERSLWLRYRLIAAELRDLGIDVNCAPMADIAEPATHPFLKNRCYGEEPETVATLARAVSDGLLAGGVLPVLKHVPGHGRATVDSHLDLPTVSESADELWSHDFTPFKALGDLPLAMTAHIVYPAFDEAPATLSPRMISLIRQEMGVSGLLMTDDISMKALKGGVGDLSAQSIAAGCDVILHCNGEMPEMEAVVAAAGAMTAAAQARADAAIAARRTPDPIDIDALEAELSGLLGETGNV
ncbi:MAG: beta-N-acetylhexosaminidase [Rhodobacteraceae bacterium]|nr:beta-N-acetylhexosaminidase [Paracoccaceae bacterium]